MVQARRAQSERLRKFTNATNSSMSPRQMTMHCRIHVEATGYLEHAMKEMNFSARAHNRILKVARTLAPSHPRTLAPSHPRTLAPSHPRRSRGFTGHPVGRRSGGDPIPLARPEAVQLSSGFFTRAGRQCSMDFTRNGLFHDQRSGKFHRQGFNRPQLVSRVSIALLYLP